jgi:hypothetical protein
MANAAVMKTTKSPHSKKWAARDMGINSSSTVKIMFLIDIFTLSLGDIYTMSKNHVHLNTYHICQGCLEIMVTKFSFVSCVLFINDFMRKQL